MKKSDGSNRVFQSRSALGFLLYCFHSESTILCPRSNSNWRICRVWRDTLSVEFMAG